MQLSLLLLRVLCASARTIFFFARRGAEDAEASLFVSSRLRVNQPSLRREDAKAAYELATRSAAARRSEIQTYNANTTTTAAITPTHTGPIVCHSR